MPINNFPALSARATFKYPEDVWADDAIVSQFEDRSVEVRMRHSTGAFDSLPVALQLSEADADTVFTFLKGQRLQGIPFHFTHRKRGTLLVRYWSDKLPMTRRIAGHPDLIEMTLPLREET